MLAAGPIPPYVIAEGIAEGAVEGGGGGDNDVAHNNNHRVD